MFTEEYLESLPNDPLLAVSDITDKIIDLWNNLEADTEASELNLFLEAYAISQALLQHVPEIEIEDVDISGHPQNVVTNINSFFNALKTEVSSQVIAIKAAQFSAKYGAKFGNVFAYEFSEGDLKKIQDLINQLRDQVASSNIFEESHKARLIARLEKVQSELHKKMADLDRFWGLVGDAGVAIGKLGKDAKPFVDRIREISDIVWRTQSRAEELPSDTPMDLLSPLSEEA